MLIVEKIRPTRSNGWRIIYRGSFYGARRAYPLLTISGDLIKKPELLDAKSGYLLVSSAGEGEKISPDSKLLVEVLDEGVLLSRDFPLGDLIEKPLSGYIELIASSTELTVRSFKYTWGHSISFDTGSSHPSVKMISEITYIWGKTPSHDDAFFERGLIAKMSFD